MGAGAFILAALKVLPLILDLVRMFKQTADEKAQRGLGYDEAVKQALEEGTSRLKLARDAELAAEKDHAAHPADDGGFDREFDREFERK